METTALTVVFDDSVYLELLDACNILSMDKSVGIQKAIKLLGIAAVVHADGHTLAIIKPEGTFEVTL